MSNHSPIPSPSAELVGEWLCSEDYPWGPLEQTSITITTNRLQNIATKAAQWGADQELEACCELVPGLTNYLRNIRRPTPQPEPPELTDEELIGPIMWMIDDCIYDNDKGEIAQSLRELIARSRRSTPLPPNYIDPGHTDRDRELLEIFYVACQSEGGTADEIHLRGIRAVLAANPTPPADGEAAELEAQ